MSCFLCLLFSLARVWCKSTLFRSFFKFVRPPRNVFFALGVMSFLRACCTALRGKESQLANCLEANAGTPQTKKSNVLSLTAFAKFIFNKSNCMCKCRALQNHLKLAVPSETLELLTRLWFAALQADFLKNHYEKNSCTARGSFCNHRAHFVKNAASM